MKRLILIAGVLLLAGCKGSGLFGLGGGGTASSPPSSLPIGSLIPTGTFAVLGVAAAVCVVVGVLSALSGRYVQGLSAFGIGVTMLVAKALLEQYSTVILVIGVIAAVWYARTYGINQIRDRALAGFKKLNAEGAVKEATALLRLANPKVDLEYRRKAAQRSGSSRGASSDLPLSPPATGGGSPTDPRLPK